MGEGWDEGSFEEAQWVVTAVRVEWAAQEWGVAQAAQVTVRERLPVVVE
jgi:hypothetical protein